jgi:hypothetical protein
MRIERRQRARDLDYRYRTAPIVVGTIEDLPRRRNLWVNGERQRAVPVRNRRSFLQVELKDLC